MFPPYHQIKVKPAKRAANPYNTSRNVTKSLMSQVCHDGLICPALSSSDHFSISSCPPKSAFSVIRTVPRIAQLPAHAQVSHHKAATSTDRTGRVMCTCLNGLYIFNLVRPVCCRCVRCRTVPESQYNLVARSAHKNECKRGPAVIASHTNRPLLCPGGSLATGYWVISKNNANVCATETSQQNISFWADGKGVAVAATLF